jgi:rhamnose transport system permease protein
MPACAEGASAVPADSTTSAVSDTTPGSGPAGAAGADQGFERREGGAWRGVLGRWEALLVALLVLLLPIGQAISPEFLTSDSFTTGSLDFSEIALMALPLTLVVISAEIDLSIASVLGLSSAAMAYLWNHGQPIEAIIPICIVLGGLAGAFNGLLVTRLGLPSLAVTIGTLALFRGLALVVIGDDSVTDFPSVWTDRAFGNFAGTAVPNVIVLFAVLAVVFAVLLHFTPFGRSVFAIGANEEAAFFSGLRVKRIKLLLFVLSPRWPESFSRCATRPPPRTSVSASS